MEWKLEVSQAGRSADLTRCTEELRTKEEELWAKEVELQAKEEESTTKEAGAYVNAHNDLLSELKKRYPEEDFSWMNQLILETENESDEEPEREGGDQRADNVPGEQGEGDPPTEWLVFYFEMNRNHLLFNFLMRSESVKLSEYLTDWTYLNIKLESDY